MAHGVAGGALEALWLPGDPLVTHVADADGRSLLLLPGASPVVRTLAQQDDVAATLRITDLAPVAIADRVRGRTWLHGWVSAVPAADRARAADRMARLHPRPELLAVGEPGAVGTEWALLTLDIAEVELTQPGMDTVTIEPEEYAAADPDTFVEVEAELLRHLDACHPAEVAALYRDRTDRPCRGPERSEESGDTAVRPIALDSHGLRLRAFLRDGQHDLWVAFPEPVRSLHDLRAAYRMLFATRAAR
jgi:hypothetical protein